MKRANVLITSASRKVALVRAFQRAAAAAGTGGLVLAGDVNPLSAALYEADGARLLPRTDEPGFVEALLELCERDDVGLVIPTRDEELAVFAAARDRFAAAGTLVLVSSPDAIEACTDKRRFGAAVAAAGLEAPRTWADPGTATFPAFVKPRWGKGGIGATRVDTAAELREALEALDGEAVVQELVEAPEFTIDTFLDLDGRPISCVPRQRALVVAGESTVTTTVADPELVDATLRLCTSIGLVGHVTVQAFRSPDRIAFIEINARYGGAANLGFEAGAPTPEFALRLAGGEALEPRLGEYEVGLTMLRYGEDRFVHAGDVIASDAGDVIDGPGEPTSLATRAVVFDLDDTLYPERDFVDGGFRAVAALLAREFQRSADELAARLWALHRRDGRGRLFDVLIEELGGEPDPDLVLACLAAYRGHPPRLRPVPGIAALLDDLAAAGSRLGVVSDGFAAVQRRKLEALGPLARRFDVALMTDELGPGHAKPSPVPFRVVCRLLGVPPARTIYVANDPRKDFKGAREAGLATIRFGPFPDEGGGVDRSFVDRSFAATDDADVAADSVEALARLLHADPSPTLREVPIP